MGFAFQGFSGSGYAAQAFSWGFSQGLMRKVWGELLLRSLDLRRGTYLGVDRYGCSRP